MARPHKNPQKGAMANRVTIRMADEDLELLAAMADRDGISIGEWMRTAALGTATLPESKRHHLMAGAAT